MKTYTIKFNREGRRKAEDGRRELPSVFGLRSSTYGLFFTLLLLTSFSLHAQQELGTHFMQGTWQSTYTNPAFTSDANITISLPGFYDNLSISNIKINDLLTTNAQGNSILDINGAIDKMEDQNLLREDFSLETLGLGLHLGKLSLSFSHTLKFKAALDFPKTLPQLIWQGNAQFIGQEVSFGPDVDLTAWHHYALGGAYELSKNISIGARVKFLSGIAQVSTPNTDLKLFTSDDIYQLSLDADYLVNTSSSLNFEDFENYSFSFQPTTDFFKNLFSKNTGVAFDLGVDLNFGKLNIAASVLDIGKITWEENVKNYAISGTYEYEGLDVAQQVFEDSTQIGSILDTLQETYAPVITESSFSTTLPSQFYLSARYELTNNLTLGALFYSEFYKDNSYPAFALSGNFKIGSSLQVGAIYAIRNSTFDNLGVNAALKLGPVQLVAMTDNLLTAFNPKNSHSANVRLGLNLVFGKHKEEEKEALDLY